MLEFVSSRKLETHEIHDPGLCRFPISSNSNSLTTHPLVILLQNGVRSKSAIRAHGGRTHDLVHSNNLEVPKFNKGVRIPQRLRTKSPLLRCEPQEPLWKKINDQLWGLAVDWSHARIASLDIIEGSEAADTLLKRTSGDDEWGGQKEGEGEHRVILSGKDEL